MKTYQIYCGATFLGEIRARSGENALRTAAKKFPRRALVYVKNEKGEHRIFHRFAEVWTASLGYEQIEAHAYLLSPGKGLYGVQIGKGKPFGWGKSKD